MQERVMQIVSILIKKLLVENGKLEDADELLAKLTERGFTQEEIDSALELIYSLPGTEEGATYLRHRVLSSGERHKLNHEAQAFLYQVMEKGLLAKHEFELLLWEAAIVGIPELGRREVEMLLANIIPDPERLFLTGVHLKSAVSSEESIN
jgi:Smg protein